MKLSSDLGRVDGDAPLRLKVAAELAFPDGSMTERGLKREMERGRLAFERIAGKDYTTLNYIKRMRDECRENHLGSESTSGSERGARQPGSSSTDQSKSAQDAARTIALRLIASSKATSPKSISRNGGAEIRTK
ncbi:hypothetical protein EHI44_24260 [Rhizobium leguminosarum]|nr:hypothetical protein EHI44_24260 [Rhizobium leguminosarum]